MNRPMMRSGFSLLLRNLTLLIQGKGPRKIRATQAWICLRVIGKGLLGVPSNPPRARS